MDEGNRKKDEHHEEDRLLPYPTIHYQDEHPNKEADVTPSLEGNRDNENVEAKVDEILREVRNVRRQISITHYLLSTLLLATAAWQLSEVSLLLIARNSVRDKLEKLSHPLRAVGRAVVRALKGRGGDVQGLDRLATSPSSKPAPGRMEVSPLPPVGVPELPHPDLPSLSLNGGED